MYSERIDSRLRDILDNAAWIEGYLAGVDYEAFGSDRMRVDAVERCLQRITEAVIQIGEDATTQLGLDAPWAELRNLGNRLRHGYSQIDQRIIFNIARSDVPRLAKSVREALEN